MLQIKEMADEVMDSIHTHTQRLAFKAGDCFLGRLGLAWLPTGDVRVSQMTCTHAITVIGLYKLDGPVALD